jgi:hypothetical protein
MDKPRDSASPRTRTPRRGLWVFLLLVTGLPALFSAMVLPFSPLAALPWVLASWSIVALSGYRIWRIDHPGESARYEFGWRVRGLLTAVGLGVVSLALSVTWVWVLAAAIVVGSIFLVIYAVANRDPWRGSATPEVPPEVPHDDSLTGA